MKKSQIPLGNRTVKGDAQRYRAALGNYAPQVAAGLAQAAEGELARRMWQRDVTLWPGAAEPKNLAGGLGWLNAPERMGKELEPLRAFTDEVRREGFERVLLLGVGAPHLALELVRQTFGEAEGYLALRSLASTDADTVLAEAKNLGPTTLLIVADKLGGALETRSLSEFFYHRVANEVGAQRAGRRFAAVCDPDDPLAALAGSYHFRAAFFNDPAVPGCYAALSLCGLLPAALSGVDVSALRAHALNGAAACRAELAPEDNVGLWLGTVLGVLARAGRDKLTFVLPERLKGLGAWLERLLAEATGKEGVGVVSVVGEPLAAPQVYGADRVFVQFGLDEDAPSALFEPFLKRLEAAGHPVLSLTLPDQYAVGEQLFVWQFAATVAAYQLGVNPFEQPEVAKADARTQRLLAHYALTRTMPDASAATAAETLAAFLAPVKPGDYIALQAYLPPSEEVRAALAQLRTRLRDRFRLAVTCAFGPHYLHSTGQLHKGGKNNGYFIQLVSEPQQNAPIPGAADEPSSFYVLKKAQALGDKEALEAAGRRVIGFNLGQRVVAGLDVLGRSP